MNNNQKSQSEHDSGLGMSVVSTGDQSQPSAKVLNQSHCPSKISIEVSKVGPSNRNPPLGTLKKRKSVKREM